MMAGATTTGSVRSLRQAFSAVLEPGQAGYDEARRIHNGLIDKHPAVIARCLHTTDVVAAVDFVQVLRGRCSIRLLPMTEALCDLHVFDPKVRWDILGVAAN